MKKQQNHSLVYLAIGMSALFIAVVALIFTFMAANRNRISDQNRQYLQDASDQTVKRINDVFSNAEMSVQMVSRLYELQLDEPRFDFRLLNDMSEPTPFESIRFVSPDGVSYSGDGSTVNCIDREYYIQGIKGKSGIEFIPSSRFTTNPIFIFYSPLYYHDEIIGVVYGVISSSTFTEELQTSFFDIPASACICSLDGDIVASSWFGKRQPFSTSSVTPETMKNVLNAIRNEQSISFTYKGRRSDGSAYLVPLDNKQFMLVQTFPASVNDKITERANQDAIKLEVAMITLFLLYIIGIIVYYVRRNHRLVNEKEDLSQIVNSVQLLYRRFVILDLEEDTYEYLKEGDIPSLGLKPDGQYSEWLEEFRTRNAEDPRFWGNMEDMSVEHLKTTLTKENWYGHREYRTPDGRWERLSLIKLDMDSDVTNRVLGAVEDITDAKKRDEESRNAMETAFHAAEAASRAKSDFLSRMSHDIRTPMNAIVGLTAIMGAHLDDRDRIVDCLTKITSSSKHLLGLINEVLDMSKIESGKLALSDGEFSLPSMIDDLLSMVQPTVNAKHQHLSVHVHDISHEDVIGDSLRLQQVFINILSNAVKYTGEGGHIVVDIRETPCSQPLIGKYEFVFKDDGIGMSPEFMGRIFSPFERAEDERVSHTQGTGLGMSIAQSIIRLMGGDISVESEVNKGSTFTVRLALKLQDIDVAAEERLIGLPVLVADDDEIACETTCLILNDLGMKGEWVLSGKEAVERVVEHHKNAQDFFAVIIDWKMPEMDGIATAKAIRKEVGPEVPIIILSAYDWSDVENEARAAGVNAFIGKPLFKSRLRGVFVNLVSDTTQAPEDPLSAFKEKNFSGKRALLVEDNELNQEIAKEILEMSGIAVDVAENGQVAVDRFSAAPIGYYNIVFMDIQMPIMNGLESARAIRVLQRPDAITTPIVAMTANTFSEDVQASLNAGMNQHISKPIDVNQLMSVLEQWL